MSRLLARSAIAICVVAGGGCGRGPRLKSVEPVQARVEPRCTSLTDEIAKLDLHLRVGVADMVVWPLECTAVAPRTIRVELDGEPIGEVTLACTGIIQAPPRRVYLQPTPAKVGQHELRVFDGARKHEGWLHFGFPGLEIDSDGRSIQIGEEVLVWVSNDEVKIEPPSASRKML